MSDTELLALIDQHRRVIHSLCYLYRDNREDQKDLFQDIVYELCKKRDTIQDMNNIGAWIYIVAFNTATEIYMRKDRPRVIHLNMIAELSEGADERPEQRGQLLEAMRYLNDDEKAILMLYLEQVSYEDIAKITGISISLVGVRLNRIKAKIKNIIKNI